MTTTIYITPTYFECAAGKFKSTSRYLRAGASGARFPIALGKTMIFDAVTFSVGGAGTALRYSVNGYVMQQSAAWGGLSGDQTVSSGSFSASVTLVKF